MGSVVLVRFGAIPEVGRFQCPPETSFARDQSVVVATHRGLELGEVLEAIVGHGNASGSSSQARSNGSAPFGGASSAAMRVVRAATAADLQQYETNVKQCRAAYTLWVERIKQWNLTLELLDLEWTLDRQKLILYVLSGRGAETTKLALQAATAETTVVEVQPVTAEGLAPTAGGGCGSHCGCRAES